MNGQRDIYSKTVICSGMNALLTYYYIRRHMAEVNCCQKPKEDIHEKKGQKWGGGAGARPGECFVIQGVPFYFPLF